VLNRHLAIVQKVDSPANDGYLDKMRDVGTYSFCLVG
jgi:hypothetical protein